MTTVCLPSLSITLGNPALREGRVSWLYLAQCACEREFMDRGRPQSDEALDVRASRDGDADAFERLVRRHQSAIAVYMRRFSRDPSVLEELVQDVFVQAYFSLRSFKERAPFFHWLRRIATRVGYRFWRERSSQPQAKPLDEEALKAPENSSPAEAAEVVHLLLERLAPRDRLVLTLMYLEELSVAEIAELTEWTRTAVKVRAHRARKRLEKLLGETESAP